MKSAGTQLGMGILFLVIAGVIIYTLKIKFDYGENLTIFLKCLAIPVLGLFGTVWTILGMKRIREAENKQP